MKATAEKEKDTLVIPQCIDCGDRWVCGRKPVCQEMAARSGWIPYGKIKFRKSVSAISLEVRLTSEGEIQVQVNY
ncbi:MAG TPA: hypothetical protein ENH11_03910 [Candidatus Acetothermia bacterium]|nr:hypothetical protein [Candidatus Acetothermia bacterium]